MSNLVDIALPANAQKAAEVLGLRVQRNISSGAWVRRIPGDEAEIDACVIGASPHASSMSRGTNPHPTPAPGTRPSAITLNCKSIRCFMSAKKKRAWFVCPQWQTLVADHYADDGEAARALHTDPRVLTKLRLREPVAKSTVLKMLRQVGPGIGSVRRSRTSSSISDPAGVLVDLHRGDLFRNHFICGC